MALEGVGGVVDVDGVACLVKVISNKFNVTIIQTH